jgi:glyoxylase-like metal-dependent hydrolase (beta-lactamase superfamily II)
MEEQDMPDGSDTDLYFRQQPVGQMANLAYLVGSRTAREVLIVDPAWDVDQLLDLAAEDDMEVVGALVTHYHQDHVGGELFGHRIPGLDRLMARKPVPVHVNTHEAEGLLQVTGLSRSDLAIHEGGDVIAVGSIRTRLLHTPGHTPGSQCFLVEEPGRPAQLVSGDTLFLGACGRVDLPGSDPEAMYRSLNDTLRKLPDETLLFPGHLYSSEAQSTMGEQKRTNPFLRAASLEMFLNFMGA